MVSLTEIRASNRLFASAASNSNLVAVFVGATSGIGLGTLRAFTSHAVSPKVYIVGRSLTSFQENLSKLRLSNPGAVLTFIEEEVSLIKNIDEVCDAIKEQEAKVDVLFMTVGTLQFGGRDETIEGIDIPHCLRYFARLRFVHNLLSLLTASSLPRVVSILAGGLEKTIDIDDIEVKRNFSAIKGAEVGTTLTTLSFEHLSECYPSIAFIHKYPGFVSTGSIPRLLSSTTGLLSIPAFIARYTLFPLISIFATSIEEAGERGLFVCTASCFPPPGPTEPMISAETNRARDSVKDGSKNFNGVYRLGPKDDVAPEGDVLPTYRREGARKKIYEETVRVWERALERSG